MFVAGNIEFATQKTLTSHIKYKHETSRTVYPCLECSDTFATVWSVYRHLYNVHRKTVPEVRKMRAKLQAKAYKVEEDDESKSITETESVDSQQQLDEENLQWMENFESDNDIQMCGGCGRRFERKAALNSHSQTCQKRIAARNLINNNKQKRIAAAEDKLSVEKRNIRPTKTEFESEKRHLEMDKYNVAKKRKIGIQIRYDYSKPALDKIGTSVRNSKPYVENSSDDVVVKDSLEICNNINDSLQHTEKQSSATESLSSALISLCSKPIENTIGMYLI